MSDDRHDEIAARLREEAGAHAPERLRADVMTRVRAEPRPRRMPRRRSPWRPLGTLAAAACVLAALVFGIAHLPGTGNGPGEASGGGAGAASASAGERLAAPAKSPTVLGPRNDRSVQTTQPTYGTGGLRKHLTAGMSLVPRPLQGAFHDRAAVSPVLPRALESLLTRGRGSH